MLSSTAKNLYWMGRYLQRTKTTARLIEATQRMALQSRGKEAEGVVAIFGMDDEFRQRQSQGFLPKPSRARVCGVDVTACGSSSYVERSTEKRCRSSTSSTVATLTITSDGKKSSIDRQNGAGHVTCRIGEIGRASCREE